MPCVLFDSLRFPLLESSGQTQREPITDALCHWCQPAHHGSTLVGANMPAMGVCHADKGLLQRLTLGPTMVSAKALSTGNPQGHLQTWQSGSLSPSQRELRCQSDRVLVRNEVSHSVMTINHTSGFNQTVVSQYPGSCSSKKRGWV